MAITNKDLKRRILEISYKYKLSHIGSCLTAVDIIEEIYQIKKPNEKFVLSAGHAGLALYCVIEKHLGIAADGIFNEHGVHPDRCEKCHIDCSSGSLGNGAAISTGIALANRDRLCYVLISDGEAQEGIIYETLEVAHQQKLSNLKVYINCNGWGAYQKIERDHLIERCRAFTNVNITFRQTNMQDWPNFLQGQQSHYKVLSEEEYKLCKEILKDNL